MQLLELNRMQKIYNLYITSVYTNRCIIPPLTTSITNSHISDVNDIVVRRDYYRSIRRRGDTVKNDVDKIPFTCISICILWTKIFFTYIENTYIILYVYAELDSIKRFVMISRNGQEARGDCEWHSLETCVSFTVRFYDRQIFAYINRISDTHDKPTIDTHHVYMKLKSLNEENWAGHARDALKVVAKSRGYVH